MTLPGRNMVSIPQKARSVLRARLHRGHPVYLIHSLTNRCNAQCKFCAWHYQDNTDELSTAEVKALYSEARAAGFFALSFWGGEPLVRRDLPELCEHAWRLGFMTHMVTNGALLERKMHKVMPYLDRICISVDHPSELHDEMRGVPGLYGKIMSATRELRRCYPGRKVVYVYTFQSGNTDPADIRRMAATMKELGVVGVFNAMRLEAANDSGIDLEQFKPEPEELAAAFRTVRQLKREGFPVVNSNTHLEMMMQGPPRYRCHWPKFMLPVEANGDMVDCMHWGRRPVGNVRQESFTKLLNHPRLRALAGKEGEACHKCVSLHRVDISEACEGRLEPLKSWFASL